ncbi:hypothetical protein JW948_16760 [bacterium]|nr:hypothetical protein [bacterium]
MDAPQQNENQNEKKKGGGCAGWLIWIAILIVINIILRLMDSDWVVY